MHETDAAKYQSKKSLLKTNYLFHNSMIGLIHRFSLDKIRKLSSHLEYTELPITKPNEWEIT